MSSDYQLAQANIGRTRGGDDRSGDGRVRRPLARDQRSRGPEPRVCLASADRGRRRNSGASVRRPDDPDQHVGLGGSPRSQGLSSIGAPTRQSCDGVANGSSDSSASTSRSGGCRPVITPRSPRPCERLAYLEANGPTPFAFTFGEAYDPDGQPVPARDRRARRRLSRQLIRNAAFPRLVDGSHSGRGSPMAEEPLAQQLATLRSLLNEVDTRLCACACRAAGSRGSQALRRYPSHEHVGDSLRRAWSDGHGSGRAAEASPGDRRNSGGQRIACIAAEHHDSTPSTSSSSCWHASLRSRSANSDDRLRLRAAAADAAWLNPFSAGR